MEQCPLLIKERRIAMKKNQLLDTNAEKLITFIYYRDLQKGIDFYEKTLGLTMEIDQGWCKIYKISEGAPIGWILKNASRLDSWPPPPFLHAVPGSPGSPECISQRRWDSWGVLQEARLFHLPQFPELHPVCFQ